jgi:hypothetical protein
VQRHDAAQQHVGGALDIAGLADLEKQRQRVELRRRQLESLQAYPLGLGGGALALQFEGALHHRQDRPHRLGRRHQREIRGAAAHGAQPAATGTQALVHHHRRNVLHENKALKSRETATASTRINLLL